MSSPLSEAQRALLAQRLRGRPSATPARIPTAPDGPIRVSAEQEQILRHTWFDPDLRLYNECVTLVHRGELDVPALAAAVDALVARHDVWHSVYRRAGRTFEQVVVAAPTHDLVVHDLRDSDTAVLADLVSAFVLEAYDLTTSPTVRFLLVRTGDREHRLFMALHHVVFDGVSLYRIALPELVALYDAAVCGVASCLPPAPQYRDYAAWQADGPLDAELARGLGWWEQHLAGVPTLALPLDRPRPVMPAHRGATTWFTVPVDVVTRLRAVGSDRGATLFHVLAAAWALCLRELTGQPEVVFATVSDRRSRRELEQMVGYCLTPVVLRVPVPDDVVAGEVVDVVRAELLDVMAHNVPFERIVRHLDPAPPIGANPLFQSMLVLEPQVAPSNGDWSMHQVDPTVGARLGHAKNDLHLELDERPEGHLSGRLIVNSDLFEPAFADRCVAAFLRAVDLMAGSD